MDTLKEMTYSFASLVITPVEIALAPQKISVLIVETLRSTNESNLEVTVSAKMAFMLRLGKKIASPVLITAKPVITIKRASPAQNWLNLTGCNLIRNVVATIDITMTARIPSAKLAIILATFVSEIDLAIAWSANDTLYPFGSSITTQNSVIATIGILTLVKKNVNVII
jgi:hypothetical protein